MDDGFDAVYESYVRAIHAYLVRLTGNRATADDLCQETFVRYFRHRDRIRDGNGALGSWLFRVAMNLAFDDKRKRRPDLVDVEPVARHGDAMKAAESRDLAARISDEVARLPDELRAAFLLRTQHEMTFPRMATALGCSERTAKDRYRKARDVLAGRLDPLMREES